MQEAYDLASDEIVASLRQGGLCLDCGANQGYWYGKLSNEIQLTKDRYYGIEWNEQCATTAQNKGLNVLHGDLNKRLPYEDDKFSCIFALSVLEHLLNGCHFMKECYRTLDKGGKLILLTPNISTYFTAFLILLGKMPSSGPHPDSDILMRTEEIIKVSPDSLTWDTESDCPVHRHLVVFSYLTLKKYLSLVGFTNIRGYGFGLYPLPNFIQPIAEKIDPYHCHQMVFIAEK